MKYAFFISLAMFVTSYILVAWNLDKLDEILEEMK